MTRGLPRDCSTKTREGQGCQAPTRYELVGRGDDHRPSTWHLVPVCGVHRAAVLQYLQETYPGTWSVFDRRTLPRRGAA